MLNELRKCERAISEFEKWLKEHHGLSVRDIFVWLDEYLGNDMMVNAIIHALCPSFLDGVGIYVNVIKNWHVDDAIVIPEEDFVYEVVYKFGSQYAPGFDSRTPAEEAGIIRVFQIREEQLKTKEN